MGKFFLDLPQEKQEQFKQLKIKLGLSNQLKLGNLDAKRDL